MVRISSKVWVFGRGACQCRGGMKCSNSLMTHSKRSSNGPQRACLPGEPPATSGGQVLQERTKEADQRHKFRNRKSKGCSRKSGSSGNSTPLAWPCHEGSAATGRLQPPLWRVAEQSTTFVARHKGKGSTEKTESLWIVWPLSLSTHLKQSI